jgi:hypothetical protein
MNNIKDQVYNQVLVQAYYQVENEVWNQIYHQIKTQVQDEIRHQVYMQLEEEYGMNLSLNVDLMFIDNYASSC